MTRRQQWLLVVFFLGGILLLSLADRFGGRVGLLAVGALAFAPYWLGPALVWLTNVSRVPTWEAGATDALDELPADLQEFFRATSSSLSACGFVEVGLLRETNLAPGFVTWVSLFVNRSLQQRAAAIANVPENPLGAIKPKPALYFRTKFVDGRVLETGNVREPNVLAPLEGYDPWQFPEVADARLIYRLHQLRLAPIGSAPREAIPEGREVAHLTAAMADFYSAQVKAGYLRVAEPGRSFRPTIMGAFLMTWKLLPPMSWLARARVRQRNEAFLLAHGIAA